MAPMITDSYSKYNNSEFGGGGGGGGNKQSFFTSSKPPLPSMSYSSDQQQSKYNSLNDNSLSNFNIGILDSSNTRRRSFSEENVIEIFKGNNYKQQVETFDDLIVQAQTNIESLINYRRHSDFLNAVGSLLSNTLSNEVQRGCLKFLQVYLKSLDNYKIAKQITSRPSEKFRVIDSNLCEILLEYLIISSVSSKLQLKQISIDLIYSYMKLTENISNCFNKFIKYGIESLDSNLSRYFMDPTLCILLTDEFADADLLNIVKSLVKQLTNPKFESSAMKCLNKIEQISPRSTFNNYLNKLPQNSKTTYLNVKNKLNSNFSTNSSYNFNGSSISNDPESKINTEEYKNMKFNLIPANTLQKLSGEDEIQRLHAIHQLETSVINLNDIKQIYPYYQDFIIYMNNFVDDPNYEVRLASLKILNIFIKKLGPNVNQCYKVICNCARQVMSQTHQSKTLKQSLNNMLLITIENMKNPILVLECLLDKIKDRSAKAREEFLNIIITAVLKFPNDKFDSLRKIFFQVAPLLCDIKRNVRHAALECIAVLYSKLKMADRQAGQLIEQLEHVPEFQIGTITYENLQTIRDVIVFRLNRNKIATINPDMTIDYGIKIPQSGLVLSGGYDPDIEWIVSASSSSASASARSQRGSDSSNTNTSNNNRIISLNENGVRISSGSFRQRSSGNKRLPWEESNPNDQSIISQKVAHTVAPLKAFPFNDEFDSASNAGYSSSNSKNGYPSSSSYQEKYLKKLGEQNQSINSSKTDSQLNTVKKVQTEKAYSLENLYNIDDNINSENNIQKRKYANLNLKNGIIPSKPTIPRRNSASKNNPFLSQNNSIHDPDEESSNPFTNENFKLNSTELDTTLNSSNKYDTVPNIRNSAKNRKKLEQIFSIGANENNSIINNKQIEVNNKGNNLFTSNKKTVVTSSSNNQENNLYLSKLKAEKNINDNNMGLNTSRYSPSNPESGIFSLSDYDNSDNRFLKQQPSSPVNKNSDGKKAPSNTNNISLVSSNNNPADLYRNEANSSPISIDVVSPFTNKPKLLRSSSKSKLDYAQSLNSNNKQSSTSYNPSINNNNNNLNINNNNNNGNNIEYNPLNGVSFKPTHSSDVEIVGVKLGNSNQESSSNYQNVNLKKKQSLKNNNDGLFTGENENGDMPNIIGKGYNNNLDTSYQQDYLKTDNADYINPEEANFPLSLSFRSRLRQKTQEKIEEKQKNRVEKLKKEKQKKELESLNTSVSNRIQSPTPDHDTSSISNQKYLFKEDFGLSISGYTNQPGVNVNGKPPIHSNNQHIQTDRQQIYSLEDYPEKKATPTKAFNEYRMYEGNDLEYMNSEYFQDEKDSTATTLPSLDKPRFKPTNATQARLKAKAAAAAAAAAAASGEDDPNKSRHETNGESHYASENRDSESNSGFYGSVKEDFIKQPFKSPENALKEAMNNLSQDDWEKKCHGMNIIRRLSVYHEDLTVNNIHSITLALLQEVKNLRSQVSRFGLMTFGDLFTNLKRYMDVDLDIAVKTILQKNAETSDFIRADVEKCLDKMTQNVTTHKAIIALINGGASHRNPLIRRTTAQYTYKCCEIMGPGKILSGIKDVTERILVTAAQFVVDGPVDIRWYGRKIFHMLMSHDEFDKLLVKYLNEKTRKNIKEILDTIKVKGPGDVPTESARNARKGIRNIDSISRSAGSNPNVSNGNVNVRGGLYGAGDTSLNHSSTSSAVKSSPAIRLDAQAQDYVRNLCAQLRNPDFRERIDAIEKFQIMCETETEMASLNIVQIFDKFNPCLTDSNSKVNYKALSTMFQIAPILGDNINSVVANVVPLLAQNLASKNSEIQDMASSILDVFVEYLDGSVLIVPFTNIAQHGNVRIRPQIIYKLADLIPHVYSRKQKQVELHVLPTLWSLLNSIKGNSSSSSGTPLNHSITKLIQNLYEQMGEQLIERAANSSSVSSRNLELLRELIVPSHR